jgi:hypothetical protein
VAPWRRKFSRLNIEVSTWTGLTVYIYYEFSLLHIFALVLQPWMSAYIRKTNGVYISVPKKRLKHGRIYIQSNLSMWTPLLNNHLYLKVTFFLSCHIQFHVNRTSFIYSENKRGIYFSPQKTIKTWTTNHYASLNQWYNTE